MTEPTCEGCSSITGISQGCDYLCGAPTDTGRPTYPQRHPAMAVARNIVNQILDEAGTDVATRQRINDDCDQFVAWMLERHATSLRP